MRERPSCPGFDNCPGRITPAYAGKTRYLHIIRLLYQDHPRVCGKDTFSASISVNLKGSPPRMRERLTQRHFDVCCVRITPAYAGKTPVASDGEWIFRDHPRVCGKDQLSYVYNGRKEGSPPRMRERLVLADDWGYFCRITPAYAGKTIKEDHDIVIKQDHPRVCGKDLVLPPFLRA